MEWLKADRNMYEHNASYKILKTMEQINVQWLQKQVSQNQSKRAKPSMTYELMQKWETQNREKEKDPQVMNADTQQKVSNYTRKALDTKTRKENPLGKKWETM